MSAWHREHPELAGTDADPCMDSPSYRQAALEVRQIQAGFSDSWIAEAERQSLIFDCEACEASRSVDCNYKPDPTGERPFEDYYGACESCDLEYVYDPDPPGALHMRHEADREDFRHEHA